MVVIDTIARSLAGRVAEKMFTDTITSGASADLVNATQMAHDIVTRYGMVEFGMNRIYTEETNNEESIKQINEWIDKLIDQAMKRAEEILKENETALKRLVDALMKKGIVEFHDAPVASPVGVFRRGVTVKFHAPDPGRNFGGDQRGVGVAETVDALLGVADNQTVIAQSAAKALLEKRTHQLPLELRSVLKFVDKEMVETRPEPFVDEGGVVGRDELRENHGRLAEFHCILLLEILFAFAADGHHQS